MRVIIANYRYFIAGGPEKYMFKFMESAKKMGATLISITDSVSSPFFNISDCTIRRPVIRETTALGACYLAGLATGVWHSREELKQLWRCDTLYAPSMDADKRRKLLSGWDKAVGRSLDWAEH